mmetsp:Transcript_136012/g.290766  ORF Transcript_136012/g.290766 Transcript_136012/m.290766 type:complete len:812 (-) Transcript_136012:100-2535(-)
MVSFQAVRDVCEQPEADRDDQGLECILDFVKHIAFFPKLARPEQLGLCRKMTLEEFERGEIVFKYGDAGDKFYIILLGGVALHFPSSAPCPNGLHTPDECTCEGRQVESAVFLVSGMSFGELALQSNKKRSATINATTRTELLVLTRSAYEEYAGELHRLFVEQRVAFLRQCPRIEDALTEGLITHQDIAGMANCLTEIRLAGQAVACRQDEQAERLIFVRSGELLMLRAVDVDNAGDVIGSDSQAVGAKPNLKGSLRQTAERCSTLEKPLSRKGSLSRKTLTRVMLDIKKLERRETMDALAHKKRPTPSTADTAAVASDSEQKKEEDAQAKADAETGEQRGKRDSAKTWALLRSDVKKVHILANMAHQINDIGDSQKRLKALSLAEASQASAQQSIEQVASVQKARKRVLEMQFKEVKKQNASERAEKEKQRQWLKIRPPGHTLNKTNQVEIQQKAEETRVVDSPAPGSPRRRRLLSVGTVRPYQYFGDQQLRSSEAYPVSLVSNPVAEIYIMSKYDIMRRLSKKIISTLFHRVESGLPSDNQLIELHRQGERWSSFCQGLSHNTASGSFRGCQALGVPRHLQEHGRRVDILSNLEFLGISQERARSMRDTEVKGAVLTYKDEELFSDVSARFLRRHEAIKHDPALHRALARAGLRQLRTQLIDSSRDSSDNLMALTIKKYWYKLESDPVGTDLDDALREEEGSKGREGRNSMLLEDDLPPLPSPSSEAKRVGSSVASSQRSQRYRFGAGIMASESGAGSSSEVHLPQIRAPAKPCPPARHAGRRTLQMRCHGAASPCSLPLVAQAEWHK